MQLKRVVSRCTTASLLALLPVATGGCGWFFVHGPPANHQQLNSFSCTQSMVGPLVDAGVGLYFTINMILINSSQSGSMSSLVAVVIDGVLSVTLDLSSVSGISKVKRCAAARSQLADRQAGRAPVAALAAAPQGGPVQPSVRPAPAQGAAPPPSGEPPVQKPSAAKPAAPTPAAAQAPAAVPAPAQPAAAPVVRFVAVTPAENSVVVGQTAQLTAAARTSSGAAVPGKGFTWSSSNDAVASVSSTGLVTARAAGLAIISARADSVVGRARVVVGSQR